jgi:hypothetical protein
MSRPKKGDLQDFYNLIPVFEERVRQPPTRRKEHVRAILFAAFLAVLIVPAAAFSEDAAGQDRANAARACSALRTSMGLDLFRQAYGTAESNRRNAFGKCVSKWTRAEHQTRQNARAQCAAEQADPNFSAAHDGKTFAQFYGTGPKGANAFGRCVSGKAKSASAAARQDTLNAARQCKSDRKTLGIPAFRAKYGKSSNDRNAFGKCVSALAKAQHS